MNIDSQLEKYFPQQADSMEVSSEMSQQLWEKVEKKIKTTPPRRTFRGLSGSAFRMTVAAASLLALFIGGRYLTKQISSDDLKLSPGGILSAVITEADKTSAGTDNKKLAEKVEKLPFYKKIVTPGGEPPFLDEAQEQLVNADIPFEIIPVSEGTEGCVTQIYIAKDKVFLSYKNADIHSKGSFKEQVEKRLEEIKNKTATDKRHSLWHFVSSSPDNTIKVYITPESNSIMLVFDNGEEKKISDEYKEGHLYSISSSKSYNIQWSPNSQYLYVQGKIYDIKRDKLITLKGSKAFAWAGNDGIYITNGGMYYIEYGEGGYSEVYTGTKVWRFRNGTTTFVENAPDGRVFALASPQDEIKMSENHLVTIPTAKLKYPPDTLQKRIDKDIDMFQKDNKAHVELQNFCDTEQQREKMLRDIESILKKYPVILIEDDSAPEVLYWDVSIRWYLEDMKTITLPQ